MPMVFHVPVIHHSFMMRCHILQRDHAIRAFHALEPDLVGFFLNFSFETMPSPSNFVILRAPKV